MKYQIVLERPEIFYAMHDLNYGVYSTAINEDIIDATNEFARSERVAEWRKAKVIQYEGQNYRVDSLVTYCHLFPEIRYIILNSLRPEERIEWDKDGF
jgi:hypothetical protein